MEDHSSSTLLETSDKLTMMSHKSREQSELIESLTRDLKQSITEKTLIKNDLSDRINALISQRNVFATHMSEMETIWNEKLQTISQERDKLQSQLKSMINELKRLADNPAVITARKHAKEMEEKLKSNENDMNLLMESIKQEKSTLIGRIHDQAISIHDLTEQDKSSDKNWINLAINNDNVIPSALTTTTATTSATTSSSNNMINNNSNNLNSSYSKLGNINSPSISSNNAINSSLLNNTPGSISGGVGIRSYSFIDNNNNNNISNTSSPYRSSPMRDYSTSNRYTIGKTADINVNSNSNGNNINAKKPIFDNELPSFLK